MEIIAEVAQGFEGKRQQSLLLLQAAAAARADAVKYQLVIADELATRDYKHHPLFRQLEMDRSVWAEIASAAAEAGIKLHFDIFGPTSLALAAEIGAEAVKIHATDIANVALLRQVSESPISRVVLGAGGANWSEIESALDVLSNKEVVIMLGFQGYPTATEDNQIARVSLVCRRVFERSGAVAVGFADHADPLSPLRFSLSAEALGAGATILEKHLTLGRCMKLEDFESALNPDEFAEYVKVLRACGSAMGTASAVDDFGMSPSEKDYRLMIRRHVVSSTDLTKGTKVEPEHLTLKRSGAEKPVMDLRAVYGKILARDIPENTPVILSDFVPPPP